MADPTPDKELEEVTNAVDAIVVDADAKSKKKKKGAKNGNATGGGEVSGAAAAGDDSSAASQAVNVAGMTDLDVMRMFQEQELKKQQERYARYVKKLKGETDVNAEHKFWDTQPVPSMGDTVTESGPINSDTDVEAVKADPFNMPSGFEWCEFDVNNEAEIQEIYNLLTENYVEDDDCNFRFDYSVPFLQWALSPPGYLKEWHVGVRNTKTRALMGCITAIPSDVRVHETVVPMVEINFLCVHKKLRTKRLAPVLIKEITRRVNRRGRWQAAYTAGVVLPKPVGRCRYWHRSLNPKKLVEIRFSSLPPRKTMAQYLKDLKLPERTSRDMRPMVAEDAAQVHALLTENLSRTKLTQVFSVEELSHVLLPREGVVSCYVITNSSGVITDFCSFYHLPSTVIRNDKYNKLSAVYSYYHAANTLPFEELMMNALVLARKEGADVFNALDLADNGPVLEPLKFGEGDGFLQYYLYNWKSPQLDSKDVGLVLL